jgi:hypothetical protein
MPRAKTAKKATLSKSDFVRSQPLTLSASEVLAKAKAAGLKLTSQLVYKVRGTAKAKGNAKLAVGAKKPAPSLKVPAPSKPPASKAAFVRGLPSSTPAKDVVKLAKAAGIKLGIYYVYNVRRAAKLAAKKPRAASKGPAVAAPVAVTGGSRASTTAESLLKAVAAELGLGPALDILQGERARVRAVIGG